MWLDEIEKQIELRIEYVANKANVVRMARVLRELAKYITELYKEVGACDPQYHSLSDDAKELLK